MEEAASYKTECENQCGKHEQEEPWRKDMPEALEDHQKILKHHWSYSGKQDQVDPAASRGAIDPRATETFFEQQKRTYHDMQPAAFGRVRKPFKCPICWRRFIKFGYFMRHWKFHERKQMYKCPECEQAFLWKTHLQTHLWKLPNTCPDCEISFSCKKSFQIHQRSHMKTKADIYTCAECGKGCLSKTGLANHQKTHFKEKTFACLECEERFACKTSFQKHQRSHKKKKEALHTCAECGKSFLSKTGFSNHQKTNSKEKTFACQDCELSFTCRNNFRKHRSCHMKERAGEHVCAQCGKGCFSKNGLSIHQKTHSKEITSACLD